MFQSLNLPETQLRILRSAFSLAEKNGFENITIRALCKDAGCSLSTFYRYFSDKTEMISYFIYDMHLQTMDALGRKRALMSASEFFVEIYISYSEGFASLGIDGLEKLLSPHNKALSPEFLSRYDKRYSIIDDLLGILKEGESDGSIVFTHESPISDVNDLYHALNVIFYGVLFDWCLFNGTYDLQDYMRKSLTNFLKDFR